MMKKYESPKLELITVSVDIITASVTVPDFDADANELPTQDW